MFVVDPHDEAADVDYQPVDLDQPAVLIDDGVAASPGNPQFHQQMVYGVASAVYASFRAALGRDPAFAVPVDATGRARLRLRPHAAPGSMRGTTGIAERSRLATRRDPTDSSSPACRTTSSRTK